jgi:hypothetical protein
LLVFNYKQIEEEPFALVIIIISKLQVYTQAADVAALVHS